MCDYGCADGGTSLPLLCELIKSTNQLASPREIQVYYEDQAENDFSSLFQRVSGRIESAIGKSLSLGDFANVFPFVVGRSFYEKCFPDNFLDFAFCSTAMHWLSKKPSQLTDTVHHAEKSSSPAPLELNAFKDQARLDYHRLLTLRRDELKPGASFHLVLFCINDDGEYLGSTKSIKASMFATMNTILRGNRFSLHVLYLRLDFVERKIIQKKEFESMTFANYYRTKQELLEPFSGTCGRQEDRVDGLEMKEMIVRRIPCWYKSRWDEGNYYDSPEAFAKDYILTTRSWSQSTFLSGLDANLRSLKEREEIIDLFFKEYEKKVMESPDDHGMDYVMAYITLTKR